MGNKTQIEPKHVISLGAGVQSSCMALMAAEGRITPMPECAIFADTQWEPAAVYRWLDQLERLLPFPVHRVTEGNIREQQIKARVRGKAINGERFAALPYFVRVEGQKKEGRIKRQCTHDYKIVPIERFIKRHLLGLKPYQRAPKEAVIIQWRGISADEAGRMKDSKHRWMRTRHPLAMELGMTRRDCLKWLNERGFEVPRSACIGCPFHSNAEWRDMKTNRPDEWADACHFDTAIRRYGGVRGDVFLHRSLVPLCEAELNPKKDENQLWLEECEGHCGV